LGRGWHNPDWAATADGVESRHDDRMDVTQSFTSKTEMSEE